MRIIVTGANGMLGTDLCKVLSSNHDLIHLNYPEFDLTKPGRTHSRITASTPEMVIHTAAYTDVDESENNPELAMSINAQGTEVVAKACKESDASLIYISTDYIFDGKKESSYTETDRPNPLSVYGRSKLIGEEKIEKIFKNYYIIRTSWLYGKSGNNFVKAIITADKTLKVVNDQTGAPTYTVDLSRGIQDLIDKNLPFGIYNMTNQGSCSWFEFAQKILELIGRSNVKVTPITSEELNRPAARPKNSRLDNSKIEKLSIKLRPWEEALKDYLKEEGILR
jgi:dTDP-4-dehydrorhamnose reductase